MVFDSLPDILTPKQITEFLQISDQSVKRAIKDGRLDAFKVGRDWRIEKKSLLKWIVKGENHGK